MLQLTVHQPLYVGRAGIGQSFQIITALQQADDTVFAMARRNVHQLACRPVKVIIIQIDIGQGGSR